MGVSTEDTDAEIQAMADTVAKHLESGYLISEVPPPVPLLLPPPLCKLGDCIKLVALPATLGGIA